MFQFRHFGQIVSGGQFFEYDYKDEAKNKEVYPAGKPQQVDVPSMNDSNVPPMYFVAARDDGVVLEKQTRSSIDN